MHVHCMQALTTCTSSLPTAWTSKMGSLFTRAFAQVLLGMALTPPSPYCIPPSLPLPVYHHQRESCCSILLRLLLLLLHESV